MILKYTKRSIKGTQKAQQNTISPDLFTMVTDFLTVDIQDVGPRYMLFPQDKLLISEIKLRNDSVKHRRKLQFRGLELSKLKRKYEILQ